MIGRLLVIAFALQILLADGFVHPSTLPIQGKTPTARLAEEWTGEVVSNQDGKIQGCSLQNVDGSVTEWVIKIDGAQADLGEFSKVVFKKILSDVKQQRFQGFRPGTVPAHLMPTYRRFSMDECAREAVIEIMQQNNIRPFQATRDEMVFESVSIPPAPKKKVKKKKKKKKNKGSEADAGIVLDESEPEPVWRSFPSMKDAVSGGWEPGQTFSFVAQAKGQQVAANDGQSPGTASTFKI